MANNGGEEAYRCRGGWPGHPSRGHRQEVSRPTLARNGGEMKMAVNKDDNQQRSIDKFLSGVYQWFTSRRVCIGRGGDQSGACTTVSGRVTVIVWAGRK
jgi:hypothetical protein